MFQVLTLNTSKTTLKTKLSNKQSFPLLEQNPNHKNGKFVSSN